MQIQFKPVEKDYGNVGVDDSWVWVKPTRGSEGAAGWDLYAAEDVELGPLSPTLVPTDLEIALPEGFMLLVLPRSGNSLKKNLLIPNSPGLIDEDYRGHLQVILMWAPRTGRDPIDYFQKLTIKRGERIAQAVLVPYVTQEWVKVSQLPPTKRGEGGSGSTGS